MFGIGKELLNKNTVYKKSTFRLDKSVREIAYIKRYRGRKRRK